MSLHVAIALCAGLAGLTWILSVLTGEHSWVDRLWSIAPPVYAVGFAAAAGWADPRLNLMAGLVVVWGARLTFNLARKGGYGRGGEDYRWAEVRRRMSPAAFAAFNLGFIAVFQNMLLLLLALPSWAALRAGPVPLGWIDAGLAAAFVLLLLLEGAADQQQWRFQRDKRRRRERGELPGPGFLSSGLFRYSRHPNFFAEICLWWVFYGLGVRPAGWLHLGVLGPLLLTALFQGSTALTEGLSAAKYPGYAAYQRRTSRLIPLPPRG